MEDTKQKVISNIYRKAIRLTFSYIGEDIKLNLASKVNMTLTDNYDLPKNPVGYWVEIRDEKKNSIFHKPLHDPLQLSYEVIGDKPNDPIRRFDRLNPKGVFELLIPDLETGSDFVLMHGSVSVKKQGQKPSYIGKELVNVNLKKILDYGQK